MWRVRYRVHGADRPDARGRAIFTAAILKKKARKRQIQRLQALQDKYITALGLRWWHRLEFIYNGNRAEFQDGHADSLETTMFTVVDWSRLWAEVHVNLELIALLSDNEIEHVFLHEMAHILIAEMRQGKAHHEERVCTNLAQVFRWLYHRAQ